MTTRILTATVQRPCPHCGQAFGLDQAKQPGGPASICPHCQKPVRYSLMIKCRPNAMGTNSVQLGWSWKAAGKC